MCIWNFYTDYYETDCGEQMEENTYQAVAPVYCPWCGNEVKIEE